MPSAVAVAAGDGERVGARRGGAAASDHLAGGGCVPPSGGFWRLAVGRRDLIKTAVAFAR